MIEQYLQVALEFVQEIWFQLDSLFGLEETEAFKFIHPYLLQLQDNPTYMGIAFAVLVLVPFGLYKVRSISREREQKLDELMEEMEEDEIEEDEHELEESNDASSGIGGSDNKQPAPAANADSTDDPEGTGAKVVAESEDGMEGESETLDTLKEEDEDEIDLEEVIRSLREEEEELEESEDGMEGESETIDKLTEKLKESYSVVKFLRSKINEVNLLNAKLLFTNKLFRNGDLNESQKLKVIETFDRAKSTREVKLVYTTLAESTMAKRTRRNKKAIKEGFASKAGGSTKPRRSVLSEGADMASRFKKLAGLTK